MTDEQKKGFTLRISEANKSELVVITFDMLLVYLEDAMAELKEGKEAEFKRSISKAKGCFDELINGLDSKYEIAQDLFSLYSFCIKELVQAELKKDEEKLEGVRSIIIPIKESFEEVAKTDTSESLMSNTQSVVAGYTYGKNDVNATTTGSNNRGFLA